ncbi:MAG: signal peptidase I [Lachnospiraceae bacterium]|nr:signal peptidase I [Lachnospiraceae bacterium]
MQQETSESDKTGQDAHNDREPYAKESKKNRTSDEPGKGSEVQGKGSEVPDQNNDKESIDNKENRRSEIASWIIIIASAVLIAFVVNRVFILKTIVTSGSMRPTMEIDEHVIANRLAYLFSDPQRGDMVFFANPENESETYVKRIIGLPGEKVEIKKGKVYINDSEKALKEPYLFEKADKLDFGPYYVPENCYFMMGDNRNISNDSRYWEIPFVSRDKIYGKALFGYRVRTMKSAEY